MDIALEDPGGDLERFGDLAVKINMTRRVVVELSSPGCRNAAEL